MNGHLELHPLDDGGAILRIRDQSVDIMVEISLPILLELALLLNRAEHPKWLRLGVGRGEHVDLLLDIPVWAIHRLRRELTIHALEYGKRRICTRPEG